MKINRSTSNQQGFAVLHVMPVILLIAIAFVGGSVYQAQVRKQDAARIAAEEAERKKQAELSVKQDEAADQKEVELPAPAPEQKPVEQPAPKPAPTPAPKPVEKQKPSYTYVGISSVTHSVNGDAVTLTATLPSAYTGTCAAKVKLSSDYSKYQYATASFSGSTCSVTVSAAALSAYGNGFTAFMSWNNSEYTVKGDHGGYNFNL